MSKRYMLWPEAKSSVFKRKFTLQVDLSIKREADTKLSFNGYGIWEALALDDDFQVYYMPCIFISIALSSPLHSFQLLQLQ